MRDWLLSLHPPTPIFRQSKEEWYLKAEILSGNQKRERFQSGKSEICNEAEAAANYFLPHTKSSQSKRIKSLPWATDLTLNLCIQSKFLCPERTRNSANSQSTTSIIPVSWQLCSADSDQFHFGPVSLLACMTFYNECTWQADLGVWSTLIMNSCGSCARWPALKWGHLDQIRKSFVSVLGACRPFILDMACH